MKKFGLFAVLLGVALFVGCAQKAEEKPQAPAEGPGVEAPVGGEAKEAAPEGEKAGEKAAEEKPGEKKE